VWATLIPILVQYVAPLLIQATVTHLQGQGVTIAPAQLPTPSALIAGILADGQAWLAAHPEGAA
jgi:hypothetical protein